MKFLKAKYITTLLMICTALNYCSAQETEKSNNEKTSRIGIKGGVNFSNLYTKNADDTKMRTGFNIGLFGKFPITRMISIQPELYYTTKGAEVSYNSTFVNGTARFHFNYIEAPLLLVINITDNFNIQAGPYAALLVSGKVTNASNIDLFNFEDNINTNDYNKFDGGFAFGAGIDIGAFSLGARYNYGLTTVGKEKSYLGTTYTFPDAKNSVINFYIALSVN